MIWCGCLKCVAFVAAQFVCLRNDRNEWVDGYIHYRYIDCTYRVIQEESAVLWQMIVCVILSKKVHMNMGPILNGYRDMVKRKYGPSCKHEQQLRNK